MSAFSSYPLVPPLIASVAVVVACVALLAARRQRRELASVRRELAAHREQVTATVTAATAGLLPAARHAQRAEEIRIAVSEALEEERERELADARAFWAEHEAREGAGTPAYEGLVHDGPAGPDSHDTFEESGNAACLELPEFEALPLLPRQADRLSAGDQDTSGRPRFRHPSDPDFSPSPAVADPEQTVARLAELADARTPLADVRPGPMGTLDLYVFTDGTTLCLTPGHSETAGRLTAALERGEAPVLLGGSGISGAFALTFTYGTESGTESVYVLADRVVASL